MAADTQGTLRNIFPELLYTVDRAATPSWRLKSTVMQYHNIMLVYDGQAEFICNGMVKTAVSGDLIYYRPGDRRAAQIAAKSSFRCYAADFSYLCPVYCCGEWHAFYPPLPFPFYLKITDTYLFGRLTNLFSALTKIALSDIDRSKNRERTIFTEILDLLIQFFEGNGYSYSDINKVKDVIGYMTEHFSEPITLSRLADCADISESYLGRIFKSVTKKSPIDYLIDIRINKAKILLRDGFSVTQTSQMAGFNDIYYFSRTFKRHEGVSPSVYTKRPF